MRIEGMLAKLHHVKLGMVIKYSFNVLKAARFRLHATNGPRACFNFPLILTLLDTTVAFEQP